MKERSRSMPASVRLLIFLLVFLGLNAIAAGGAFILAPDGRLIQMPLSNLKNSPFTDFLIPGILLFLFVGVYPFLVAYSLWKQPSWRWPEAINPFKGMHWSWAGSLAAGVALVIWITVQVQWITFGVLHAIFLVYGIVVLAVTLLPGVRRYCGRKS